MTTMLDRSKEVGLYDNEKVNFDFAVPQQWWDEVYNNTGLNPQGIVWLYDGNAPIFGRPFPITMYGWIVCRLMGYDIPMIKERN